MRCAGAVQCRVRRLHGSVDEVSTASVVKWRCTMKNRMKI
jgi:hypothetical protein